MEPDDGLEPVIGSFNTHCLSGCKVGVHKKAVKVAPLPGRTTCPSPGSGACPDSKGMGDAQDDRPRADAACTRARGEGVDVERGNLKSPPPTAEPVVSWGSSARRSVFPWCKVSPILSWTVGPWSTPKCHQSVYWTAEHPY